MKQSKRYYGKATIYTAIIYGVALIFLLISFRSAKLYTQGVNPQEKIVQAVTVDASKVQQTIQQIQSQAAEKHAAELMQQKQLAAQAAAAKQQRQQAEQQLAQLQVTQQKLIATQQAETAKAQQALAQIQQQQAQAKQQLANAQKQKQLAQAQAAAQKQADLLKQQQAQTEQSLQSQIAAEEQKVAGVQSQETQSEIDKYKTLVLNAIGQQWIMPSNTNKNLSLQLLIHVAPGGTVLDVQVTQSSGDAVLDRSVLTALSKASPLPVPSDPALFDQFRELHLTVRPEGLLIQGN
ncbi:MAG: protein TolA [Gammaproteobacteria bacterium GWF2_41_13]|nr:MAG: protein TolA [Gammaproteobacteria bacterium GWF2_41_13]